MFYPFTKSTIVPYWQINKENEKITIGNNLARDNWVL